MEIKFKMSFGQLFATSWLGLGEAETPITEDKRQNFILPKLPLATSFILVPLYEIVHMEESWRKK